MDNTMYSVITKELLKNLDVNKILKHVDYEEIGAAITEMIAEELPEYILDGLHDGDIVDRFVDSLHKSIVISFTTKGKK